MDENRPPEKLLPNRLAQIAIAALSLLIAAGFAAVFSFDGNLGRGLGAGGAVGLVAYAGMTGAFAGMRRRRRK